MKNGNKNELEKIDIIKEIMDEINKSKENGLQRI